MLTRHIFGHGKRAECGGALTLSLSYDTSDLAQHAFQIPMNIIVPKA
jgi:hypothetical protein